MKTKILICFAILFFGAFLPACKRPETDPVDIVTSNLIWDPVDKNAVYAQQFLANIYTYIPGGFNRIGGDYLDAGTDDALPSRNNTSVQYYTNGIVSTINNPDAYWGNSYSGIREANVFLANIDQVPATALAITTWKAEARFIRALMYFELVKRYGGVPLVGDKVFALTDNLQLPRNTFSDCVNYIVTECDAIKGNLNPEPLVATSIGHIPKGAAIALKCRMYLYAASPLYNASPTDLGNPALAQLTGYTSYVQARWQNVIDAADELRGLGPITGTSGYYGLTSVAQATPTQANYVSNYLSIFVAKTNNEIILAKQSALDFSVETNNSPIGFTPNNVTCLGRTSPTQNFVDAFPMQTTGLPITATGSGYVATTPYLNRDARFAADVFYNGLPWLSRTGGVQTYDGGLDKPNTGVVQTKTGYYLRKFMADFSTSTAFSNQTHNFIIFRYAEILLNEAEAYNELNQTENAAALIFLLRKRAGIAAGTSGRYGIPVGISYLDMQTLIQNERRIELAFEEHRFWDLRRWKIAATQLNGTVNGMAITNNAGSLTYQVVPAGTLTFTSKLYHMPIPYNEVVANPSLVQNAGW